MTVKIFCPSNKSKALVHHMGSIGPAKGAMAIKKIIRGCAEPSFGYGFACRQHFNLRS